jgi:hypothetical protein
MESKRNRQELELARKTGVIVWKGVGSVMLRKGANNSLLSGTLIE